MKDLPEFAVIGAARYEDAPARAPPPLVARQLLRVAQRELNDVDAAMAELRPKLASTQPPPPEQTAAGGEARPADAARLYDEITSADRAFLDRSDLLTVPRGRPIRRAHGGAMILSATAQHDPRSAPGPRTSAGGT